MKPNDLLNSFASNIIDEKTPNNNESIFADTKKVKIFLYYRETKDIHNGEILGNMLYQYDFIDGKLVNPTLLLDLPFLPGPSHNGGVLDIGPDNNPNRDIKPISSGISNIFFIFSSINLDLQDRSNLSYRDFCLGRIFQ